MRPLHPNNRRHRPTWPRLNDALLCSVGRVRRVRRKTPVLAQDAVAAWEEYEATGLHDTRNEVTAWQGNWGTDDESPASAGHR